MPNFDHKGPEGLGPKTGMQLGKCRKTKTDNNEDPINRPFKKGRRNNNNKTKITTSNFLK
ncbi:hypothetical protein SAMN05216503_1717 [Polaribacter sp. KT25b]|uniref:DUF5320 domain-containing protein n=1 Tax=Polaribacter sp. KT25b TaxID=1855336 RepID=UPI00087C5348|nr:DUF5320 domain-containing protein [Polaribacter sp. KT25b]SDS02093.1 hypothetical protein SAMN05216503_1717 [Polaribacter sp. KT25b]